MVLELVEGPTLADRIAQGPIPIDEALPIAKQIAEALEAAHEQGIIHRDLKPANIKVKDDGMVIGTAAYMAPEQAKGKVVDKRADVWAFGAVLYEMLTGKRAFGGGDVSTTLARVIEREPDWDALPSNLSPVLATYLRRCLEKEPKQRVHDIADVRLAMEGAFEVTVPAPSGRTVGPRLRILQRPMPLGFAGFVLLVTGGLVWNVVRPAPALPGTVSRFALTPREVTIGNGMALSPDGTRLVYSAAPDGVSQLFVRTLDQLSARPLAGTDGAVYPFFSPDNEWVGFFTTDSLKKVALAGGAPITLCPVGFRQGATWGPDGTIVFASTAAPGLMEVSAAGGEPRPLTEPTPEEGSHHWPAFVPDGRAVLYTAGPPSPTSSSKHVGVLRLETGERHTLIQGGTHAIVARSGHLVFAREASLWAVPFDIDRLALSGEPAPMVEGVQVNAGSNWAHFALADNGTLVYRPSRIRERSLVWVDLTSGQETPLAAPPRAYLHPRISPTARGSCLVSQTS